MAAFLFSSLQLNLCNSDQNCFNESKPETINVQHPERDSLYFCGRIYILHAHLLT